MTWTTAATRDRAGRGTAIRLEKARWSNAELRPCRHTTYDPVQAREDADRFNVMRCQPPPTT